MPLGPIALPPSMSLRAARAALAALAVAALLGPPAGVASADEAFVCGDGTVVNVKPGELEIIKRTNPCVARYFGLDVSTSDQEKARAIALDATALLRGKDDGAMPLPQRKPELPASALEADHADAGASMTKPSASPITTGSTRTASPRDADEAVDFRNVRIINAAPGSASWYRHTR